MDFQNNNHKMNIAVCTQERMIRKALAESNNIIYLAGECNAQHCREDCPIRLNEIKYLQQQLDEKINRYSNITIAGINLSWHKYKDAVFQNAYYNGEDTTFTFKLFETGKKVILDTPLEELELSVRSYNVLKRSGIKTIGDIITLTEDEFMQIRNLGQKSHDEILIKLLSMGFVLRKDTDEPS